MLFETLIISFVINAVFFFIAFKLKTDKFTDFTYSLTFIILSAYLLFKNYTLLNLILFFSVTIWALRLGSYLVYRIVKIGKDSRFDEMRDNFKKFSKFWFFQALTVWVVLLPFIVVSDNGGRTNALTILGLLIWLAGLIIESVADYQKFTRYKPNSWVDSGLWKYSRHPNYFGESLLWWGLFVSVLPYLSGLEYLSIIGPLYITFILLKVSGVPMLEKQADKKFGKNKDYQKYKKSTSKFIIWFKK